MAVAEFHRLTVTNVERETDEAVCLSFAIPPDLHHTFAFTQGQYLTLRQIIDGAEVRRSYSICSGVDEGALRVAIKLIDGGRFSTFAHQQLHAGAILDVLPPAGTFFSALAAANDHNYLCIAAGSGITPIMSIVKSILSREPLSHVTLLYGNQRVASIM